MSDETTTNNVDGDKDTQIMFKRENGNTGHDIWGKRVPERDHSFRKER